MARVLVVATSHAVLGSTGAATGAWLSEIAHPVAVLAEAGDGLVAAVDFASPRGGAVPIDPYSDPRNPSGLATDDAVSAAFLADPRRAAALQATTPLADVDASRYDAVFVAGGNGAVYDLGSDAKVAHALQRFVDAGKIVAAVCHGSAALVGLTKRGTDGRVPLVADEEVTGFTNEEEAIAESKVGITGYLPFYLETELRSRGARFRNGPPFQPFATVAANGALITGQQNFSGAAAATALVRELRARQVAALPAFVTSVDTLRQRIVGLWQSRTLETVHKADGRVLYRRRIFDIQASGRYRLLADVYADAHAAQRLFTLEFEGPYTLGTSLAAAPPPVLPATGAHPSEWTHARWWIAPQSAQFAEHVLAADPRTADAAQWELGVPVDVSEYGAIDVPSLAAGPTEFDLVAIHAPDAADQARDVLAFGERGPYPPTRLGLRAARLGGDTFVRAGTTQPHHATYEAWRASLVRPSERLRRRVAVLGSGHVGGTLGALFARHGHHVVFGSRDPAKDEVVRAVAAAATTAFGGASVTAASIAEAVRSADVVVIALPWAAVEPTLTALVGTGPDGSNALLGKVVVDATNPIGPGFSLLLGHTTSGGERVAELARGAHVVKCFNTIGYNHFTVPLSTNGKRKSLFLCGDDAAAVAWTAAVVRQLGFSAVECGPLAQARLTEPLALLWISYAYKLGKGRDHAIAWFHPAPALPAQY